MDEERYGNRKFSYAVPVKIRFRQGGQVGSNTNNYENNLVNLFGSSIVALWPQNELTGTVSNDIGGRNHAGHYTGVTLGQPGIGDGNTAASYDGTTSINNIYSAGLNTDFNPLAGTILVPIKMSGAGVWTDATIRYVADIRADASNRVRIFKNSTNNELVVGYDAGATSKSVTVTSFGGSVAWLTLALTWDKAADAMKFYGCVLGQAQAQLGTTQTGLGVWSGALAATACCIGALSTAPANVHSGSIGPVLVLNRAASAAEILQASTVP